MSGKSRYKMRDLHWNAPWPGEASDSRSPQNKVLSAVADLQRALDKRDAERQHQADVKRIQKLMKFSPDAVERIKERMRAMGHDVP